MADVERRFEAAVKVVRSMPKKGSYQPSYETMLKFYGYFKQAKEGPCTEPKPGFWDVVKKAKWEAWSALGSISNKEAMECYINELKQVMETMPDTEEMADFSSVLKSFYEAVYVPSGEEPPHILRIFKKSMEAPEKTNGHDIPKDITFTNPKCYEENSETFENESIELSLEKVSKPKEPHLNNQINGDHIVNEIKQNNSHHESNNHDSNNTMNGLTKSDEPAKDMVNSLEDIDDDIENVNGSNAPLEEDAHNLSLQPKSLYIVEVSNKKKSSPLNQENGDDVINDNDSGQNSQLRFVESNIEDVVQPDQPSASSDESEEEEFCDSIDPEDLSVLQNGLVDIHKLNNTTESHSSTSSSSPDHILTSSLTESDMSDLENEGRTSIKRNTSTPSEKKPVHVTFNVEENSTTKTKHKDSKGRRRIHEPHIAPTSSGDVKTSNHLNGGILKVKQAGSGYRGGDASKTLKQPPTSSGFSQTRGQGGGVGSSAGNNLQDSRMLHGRNTGHSDSDSDDTNPNGESCDSCGEREEINERIMIALERLQQDMSRVLRRLATMEDVMSLRQERLQQLSAANNREDQGPWWRQFIPSKTVAFLILWPFIINLIFYSWRRRKAHK